MSGSTFGKLFSVTTWGESHGPAIGAVIDGCPAGLSLAAEDIQKYLDRRKPGQSRYTTARKEGDQVQILSGVFEGRTTGTPVSVVVFNEDQRSRDYSNIKDIYRPGHADYSYDAKYGFRDYRGGGRSSGRETIGRVAAGAIAAKLLKTLGIRLTAYTRAIGPVKVPSDAIDLTVIRDNPLYMPDQEYAKKASAYLETCMQKQDSAGGIVECLIDGVPAGIGDPVFEKLDASLAKSHHVHRRCQRRGDWRRFCIRTAFGQPEQRSFYLRNRTLPGKVFQSRRRDPGRDQRRQPDHSKGRHKAHPFHLKRTKHHYPRRKKHHHSHPGTPTIR